MRVAKDMQWIYLRRRGWVGNRPVTNLAVQVGKSNGFCRQGQNRRCSPNVGNPSIAETVRHNSLARPNLSEDNTKYSSHQTRANLLIESATDWTLIVARLPPPKIVGGTDSRPELIWISNRLCSADRPCAEHKRRISLPSIATDTDTCPLRV